MYMYMYMYSYALWYFIVLERGEVFQVVPSEREIYPNTTVVFDVTFWPVSIIVYMHSSINFISLG